MIVIGYDKYRRSIAEKQNKYDIGATVAIINSAEKNYFNSNSQTVRKELGQQLLITASMSYSNQEEFFQCIRDFLVHVSNCLDYYVERQGSLPEKIMFYRDRVGDGQLETVFDDELQILRVRTFFIMKTFFYIMAKS